MAEEYKNTVPEHETPKVTATEEPSEVKDRGMFDFLGKKKDEVKPEETTTLESEFDHKAKISEPELKAEHEEVMENKIAVLEELQEKTEEDEVNKPSEIENFHRSIDEEGDEKKIDEGDEEKKGLVDKMKEKLPGHHEERDVPVATSIAPPVSESVVEHHQPQEEEKKGVVDKIKEKLPGHSEKTDDSPPVSTTPMVVTEHKAEEPTVEKKGILEKIKEKLPGYHAEEKKEKETH